MPQCNILYMRRTCRKLRFSVSYMEEKEPITEKKEPKTGVFKKLLPVIIFVLSSAATIVLTVYCVAHIKGGFIEKHATVIMSVSVGIELIYIAVTLFFMLRKSKTVSKLLLTGLVLAAVLLAIVFLLQVTGLLDRIDSVDELRNIIQSAGVWAPLIFIIFQFLQVVVLPVPGTLTVGAGVLLFGPLLASVYSLIGIFLGSLTAFWIGRSLGYRAAAWLVGKEDLDKWLHTIKGKDRVVLGAMFLLPIFPDDVLCFVAGLSTMSWRFFIVLQVIARTISVFATSYSLNGSIIPYNTWWGILIWCLLAAAVIALFVLLFKKGDKIEKWFFGLFKRKKQGKEAKGAEVSEIVDAAKADEADADKKE